MSIDANRLAMDRFTKFINTSSEEMAAELISPDAVFWIPGRPEPMRGLGGYMQILGMMRSGFSDIQWTLEQTIIEGDKVAARFTMRGTHDGAFLGVPATGRKIEVRAMNFYTWVGGKIVDEYGQPDMFGLMHQIGALPPS